jgi:transcription antitermination factor NusG
MQLQDIIMSIHQLTADEAARVMEAARMRCNYMSRATLSVGDTVRFNAGPQRGMRQGKIIKINTKRYVVDCGVNGRWNVTPDLLTKVETAEAN